MLSTIALAATAQDNVFNARIVDINNQPVEGAIVSVSENGKSVITDSIGSFSVESETLRGFIKISAEGFYVVEYPLKKNALPGKITLVPNNAVKSSGKDRKLVV